MRLSWTARGHIFVLGRSFSGGKLDAAIDPEALALLSVKLAEIFIKTEDHASSTRPAGMAFELDASSLAQWSTPAPPSKQAPVPKAAERRL